MTDDADSQVLALRAIGDVLLRQEAGLDALVTLALEEQQALIHSDFPEIERVSGAMASLCRRLEPLDREREVLVDELGSAVSLEDVARLAARRGENEIMDQRHRLIALAGRLRALQETNAALILNAVKLRERWFGLLAGMTSTTYGAAGRQELSPGRGLVSKSA